MCFAENDEQSGSLPLSAAVTLEERAVSAAGSACSMNGHVHVQVAALRMHSN